MENSISYYKNKLMQEVDLPGDQEKIDVAEPKGKITAADFAKLRANKDVKEESEDHEVSMANNSLESIVKAAMELKAKMGDQEKDIPAWIQDHITNAANFISQAAENYHEYGDHEEGDMEDEEIPSIMENEFISLEDFSKNLERYKKGNIEKSQLINSYNKLEAKDQDKAKELAKGLDVLPNPKKNNESKIPSLYEMLKKK